MSCYLKGASQETSSLCYQPATPNPTFSEPRTWKVLLLFHIWSTVPWGTCANVLCPCPLPPFNFPQRTCPPYQADGGGEEKSRHTVVIMEPVMNRRREVEVEVMVSVVEEAGCCRWCWRCGVDSGGGGGGGSSHRGDVGCWWRCKWWRWRHRCGDDGGNDGAGSGTVEVQVMMWSWNCWLR